MKVLALDLALTTGFCFGESDSQTKPLVGHWNLRSPHLDLVPGVLAYELRVLFKTHGVPDFIAIEQTINPKAQPSAATIRSQERCHGAALGVAGIYRVPHVLEVYPATIRAHFLGKANMGDRAATKRAVVARARQLGYAVESDDDADAVALWDLIVFSVLRQPVDATRLLEKETPAAAKRTRRGKALTTAGRMR